MKAFALLLLLAVGAVASDMKVEVRLNDHVGHEHSRFYMNPGDFSCAKVARTHATDGQLHSKCGFQWSLERKDHEEITVGFHGPKSHLDVAFDLKCVDVIHAASAKGAKTLIHDNLAADGSSSESHHVSSSHSSLIETGNPSSLSLSHSDDDLSVSSHDSLTHHSSSSSSSSSHGVVLATLKISDDKFLADLAQYCGHEGSESSESSHESSEGSSSESSGSDESSEGSSSGSDSGSSSGSGSGSGSGDSGSGSASSFSSGGSSFGSDSLPGNSGSAVSVAQSIASSSQSS